MLAAYTVLAACTILVLASTGHAYAEQVTLSGDLQNNPMAQEILKNIEKSREWIKALEKQYQDNSERQKELDEKRALVQKLIQRDQKELDELMWRTFDNLLLQALENSTAKHTSSIYDHPWKFTASKAYAGREAMRHTLLDGGTPSEAQQAFASAAAITRNELVAANALYNIINGLAYYNQQVLFELDGSFDYELFGPEIQKYYQDYKTNPGYLEANPRDKIPWQVMGKDTPPTECRLGQVVLHRTHAGDYICTTEYNAEMWVRHDMGTLAAKQEKHDDATIESLQRDQDDKKIEQLNAKVGTMQRYYEVKLANMTAKYELLLLEIKSEQEEELRDAIKETGTFMPREHERGRMLEDIRLKYDKLEARINEEQGRVMDMIYEQHIQAVSDFAKNYQYGTQTRLVWEAGTPVFEMRAR